MSEFAEKIKKTLEQKVKDTSTSLNKLKNDAKETYQALKEFFSPIEDDHNYVNKYKEKCPYPIILIHGYRSGADCWDDFIPLFEQSGYMLNRDVFNFSYSTKDKAAIGDIVQYAEELSAFVDKILKEQEKEQIVLVVHSMGGLISRYYIEKLGGADKVAKLIMLGTPNRGSGLLPDMLELYNKIQNKIEITINEIKFLSNRAEKLKEKEGQVLGKAAEMMEPGSEFLEDLGYKARSNFFLIAGIKGLPKVLDDPNDGAVELKSAVLDGMDQSKILPIKVNHFELHKSLKVFNKMMEFIIEH